MQTRNVIEREQLGEIGTAAPMTQDDGGSQIRKRPDKSH